MVAVVPLRAAFVIIVVRPNLRSQDSQHGRQHRSRDQSLQHGLTP
jgi:hypothetical protein